MPTVRGRLTRNAALAPLVWFKTGGAAEWLFEPKDLADLQAFLRDLDPVVPVMALGLGSNMIVRDGGVPGVVIRLGNLMEDFQGAFNDADAVYVTPVYPAGEAPIEGIDAAALVAGLKARGHRDAHVVGGADELAEVLADKAQAGDMVVCLGAGDITKWAAGLADAIGQRVAA